MTEIQKSTALTVPQKNFLAAKLEAFKSQATEMVTSELLPNQWLFDPKTKQRYPTEVASQRLAVAFMYGRDVGLQTFSECVQYLYVVNGTPTLYGSGHNIVIQRSNMLKQVLRSEWNQEKQQWELELIKRESGGGESHLKVTYSLEQANHAGLTQRNQTWQKHPREMCERKCWAQAYSRYFPAGINSYDEMDHATGGGDGISDYVDVTPKQKPELDLAGLHEMNREDLLAAMDEYPEHASVITEVLSESQEVEYEEVKKEEEQHKSVGILETMLKQAESEIIKVGGKTHKVGAWLLENEVMLITEVIDDNDGDEADKIIKNLKGRREELVSLPTLFAGKDGKVDEEKLIDYVEKIGIKVTSIVTGQEEILSEENMIYGGQTQAKSK